MICLLNFLNITTPGPACMNDRDTSAGRPARHSGREAGAAGDAYFFNWLATFLVASLIAS